MIPAPTARAVYPSATRVRGIRLTMKIKQRPNWTHYEPVFELTTARGRGRQVGIITNGWIRAWIKVVCLYALAEGESPSLLAELAPPLRQLNALRRKHGLPAMTGTRLEDQDWSRPNAGNQRR